MRWRHLKKTSSRKRFVTILELLIVAFLFGLATATLTWRFPEAMAEQRFKNAVGDIKRRLKSAKELGLYQGLDIWLDVTVDNGDYISQIYPDGEDPSTLPYEWGLWSPLKIEVDDIQLDGVSPPWSLLFPAGLPPPSYSIVITGNGQTETLSEI